MTTNSPQQPSQPQKHAYNPITFDDLHKSSSSFLHRPLDELADPAARVLAVPLFAFIFFSGQRMPLVAPLAILILLGCLFARMDGNARQIAAVPLTLSALKLAFAVTTYLDGLHFNEGRSLQPLAFDPGFFWLPMFFSACLMFIRKSESATFRIVFVGSCLLLAAGLLPGQAFIAIFYMLDVMLFLAIVVGIFIDLNPGVRSQSQPQPNLSAAH